MLCRHLEYERRPPGKPMCKAMYLDLTEGRCPLSKAQRSAAYEYFEMYQGWLLREGRHDECDRILSLVNKLKSVKRAQMEASIWKEARVRRD